jgi:hypothetical protein
MSKAFSLPRHVLAGSGVRRPESDLLASIVVASPANAQLEPEPIPQEWILDGPGRAQQAFGKEPGLDVFFGGLGVHARPISLALWPG